MAITYMCTLSAIKPPNGSTILPINDISIWLLCAGITDVSYSTLSEVLSDSSTLSTLISSNNAVNYMVRSVDWVNSVCADATAMGFIGANDYCANTLLSNNTWFSGIINSAYISSVLTVSVPTMTSDTTPNGTCITESYFDSNSRAFKAFDNNDNTHWNSADPRTSNTWVGYTFENGCQLKAVSITPFGSSYSPKNINIQGKTVDEDWTNIGNSINLTQSGKQAFSFASNTDNYISYRVYVNSNYGANSIAIKSIQFYGRA